ncbi:TolC family protein [Polynucleobacter sp. MWH-Spelu-300-X4]|uniref:TolC family protein n=1 Tax=Polynucleobacter sp. MWH-Spelu-300-X4 TaxID=2689109 RepID=UPI001BFE9967|nr:TolC family protein [Polynucleobacter sp. MWH-Spelu-300-X4]QWD80073.1 TolC family protein [Polynucleobacter sp. MWH-Spelu-300-X4]
MKANILRQKKIVLAMALALGTQGFSAAAWAQDKANGSSTPSAVSAKEVAPTPALANNDLLSLYREAALNDPVFNAAKYGYLAGKEKLWQGLSVLLPQVSAVGSETKNNVVNKATYAESRYLSRGWTVKLTQPLFNWDKWEQFRQGDMASAIAEAQYAAAEQDLVLRVTEAYFNVLNAQDTLNLARNKKVLINEQLEQAKRNFEVGTATITDTHEAQSRYDLVIAQELAAEADVLIKRSALEQLTGKPIGNIKTLSTQAKIEVVAKERKIKLKNNTKPTKVNIENAVAVQPDQTIQDWVKQAEEVSYSIIASKLAYEVANKDTNRAIAGHAPSVDLIAQRGYNDAEAVTGQLRTYNNQAMIQVTVPLFAGGYTQSLVREKSALASKALADYENTRRSIAQATRQAYLGFNNGLAQVKAYEAAEISALSALESNKLGYEVGVRINIDVLNAQDTLFTTRRDLAKARYDTILNGLRLKAQAAVLSDEDLQSVNALLK